MNVCLKIFESLRDGSLAFRICNRFSRVKWEPVTEPTTTEVIAKLYPGDGWRKLSPAARSVWVKFHELFAAEKIRTVLWVGAHFGDGAVEFDEAFPGLEFFLLEPASTTFARLSATTAARSKMRVLNVAAGAKETELQMYVDEFSPSSSLLDYEAKTLERYPFLGRRRQEVVKVRTVDAICAEAAPAGIDLMVVDAQGYEDAVLSGAHRTLRGCRAVCIEMSLAKLYVGASTFESVYDTLVSAGFRLRHITSIHRDTRNEIVQIDGLFLREPHAAAPAR